ncbi:MAG TPA: pur operon repressor [bacterium]|nr:pur operon repressor [bacterium]
MRRLRRGDRMVAIAHRLLQEPHTVFPLGTFTEMLGVAKSSISEDVASLRQAFDRFAIGRIETLAGASGGVRYSPTSTSAHTRALAEDLARRLREPARILPGGFLYTADLLSLPSLVSRLGDVFATFFADRRPDVVLSMEVQGIPLALMTARAFNVPLVTARRGGMGTEGPSVGVNYVSGSSRVMQSMTLPLRAVPPGARALFIDDFLRGGGTARGVYDLMREFQAEIVGIGVLIETTQPREKLVDHYISLLVFDGIDEAQGIVRIAPSRWAAGDHPTSTT